MEGQRRILPGSARAPPSLPLHRHGYGILNPLKKKAVNLTAPDQPPQTQKSRHSQEDDELRWDEEDVFSDSMFYSFWFYTKEVLADALNGLGEVPQESAESISSLKELL